MIGIVYLAIGFGLAFGKLLDVVVLGRDAMCRQWLDWLYMFLLWPLELLIGVKP